MISRINCSISCWRITPSWREVSSATVLAMATSVTIRRELGHSDQINKSEHGEIDRVAFWQCLGAKDTWRRRPFCWLPPRLHYRPTDGCCICQKAVSDDEAGSAERSCPRGGFYSTIEPHLQFQLTQGRLRLSHSSGRYGSLSRLADQTVQHQQPAPNGITSFSELSFRST